VVGLLRAELPQLFSLGEYAKSERRGPSIWLKCVVARTLRDPEYPSDAVPILYLPRVSRVDLRAIEQCPRPLQPLAELQYRGVFWSQQNAKDWTLFAFLVSENGGLGLDVAEDSATKASLIRVADAAPERLLGLKTASLRDKRLDATFFDSLLAPDHKRDLLAWMNDPKETRTAWQGAQWRIFVDRCRQDYGFHPEKDGELSAAEWLAAREGEWRAVWALYAETYRKHANIHGLLRRVAAPSDMFADRSGYPAANDEAEQLVRKAMKALASATPEAARAEVIALEQKHGERRGWLWAEMGHAPLAMALEPLALIATLAQEPFGGPTFEAMAKQYREKYWRVDDAALRALATVRTKDDSAAVEAAVRAMYVPWLQKTAERFQDLVKSAGGLGGGKAREPRAEYATSQCLVFVDGLRFDLAQRLVARLVSRGMKADINATWTTTPSVTASGKAWVSPVAGQLGGATTDLEFQPSVKATGAAANAPMLRRLLTESGWQVLNSASNGDPAGRGWVETGDLDHYGHEHGLRLARDADDELGRIIERIEDLLAAGWKRVRVVTDHGWLLVPGGLPKVDLPKFLAETRWGRCAVLREQANAAFPVLAWDWNPKQQIALAPGVASFIAGAEYAHGGLTLQESLVPVIDIKGAEAVSAPVEVKIVSVKWQGLRCRVSVEAGPATLYADLRLKAADGQTSVLDASTKADLKTGKRVDGGQVSLAAGDEHEGAAVALVIVNELGTVLAKQTTTIGE
jgi:hypothetical protein